MTLAALRASLDSLTDNGDYNARMMHPVPRSKVIDREEWILAKCKGKVVLDIGCSGPLHAMIEKVAAKSFGIDRVECRGMKNFSQLNIESDALPIIPDLGVVVCGEVIEHLSNPGLFLDKLHQYPSKVIVTVPNALSSAGVKTILKGVENVNIEHVCYYSYTTFKTLAARHGYRIEEFYWYKGQPYLSEGMCFLLAHAGG